MLMGETHDYTLATKGWMKPGFDDSAWAVVATGTANTAPLQAHPGTPVTRHERIVAKSVKEVEPGVFIYDIGQNLAGWAAITLDGKAGQRVRVRVRDGKVFVGGARVTTPDVGASNGVIQVIKRVLIPR